MKTCTKCNLTKPEENFSRRERGKEDRRNVCRECHKAQKQIYYEKNKLILIEKSKEYYAKNKEQRLLYVRSYHKNNKVKINGLKKNYYRKNVDRIRSYMEVNKSQFSKRSVARRRVRRHTDPSYALRCRISGIVRNVLSENGSSKNGKSILEFLPYSMQELKEHLEKQFEPWMNWKNRGNYNPNTWINDDLLTWTWQLDHIIPQSELPYSSMEDENFRKCWALSNLRPLSSKQNVIEGAARYRHENPVRRRKQ